MAEPRTALSVLAAEGDGALLPTDEGSAAEIGLRDALPHPSDYQAVIMAGGVGAALFPVTEGLPKPLLPIALRPALWYSLKLVENAGFESVIVITTEEVLPEIRDLYHLEGGSIAIDWVVLTSATRGTADALRMAADRITRDFFVLPCDLLAQDMLQELADKHRVTDATVTMTLKTDGRFHDEERRGKPMKPDEDEQLQFIGLDDDDRVVYYVPHDFDVPDEAGDVVVPKRLLKSFPSMRFHVDLRDPHVYLFSPWVLDVLAEKDSLTSIQSDLIPFLVAQQSLREPSISAELLDKARARARTGSDSMPVHCYAYVLPIDGPYCSRVDTIPQYMAVSSDALELGQKGTIPWARPPAHCSSMRDSLLDADVEVGERVTVSKSAVGRGVKLGKKAQLRNTIVMPGAVIGAGCIIQNSVICSGAEIGAKCNLKDCQIGAGVVLAAGSKHKGDSVTKADAFMLE